MLFRLRSFVGRSALYGLLALAAACSRNPNELKKQYMESGDAYAAQKKYSEAVIQYRNAINIDPRFGEARMKLGRAYANLGEGPSALSEYVRAADLLPDDIDAQLAAGAGLLAKGDYPEARARALAVIEKQPKNVEALLLLGNSLAGLKDLDGAIQQIEAAIDTDPERGLSYANLGQLRLAQGNAAAAESALQQAISVEPKAALPHLSLANYYWASGKAPEAERELKLALELEPKSALANRALAAFYLNSGRPDESEPFLKSWAEITAETGPKLILADLLVKGRRVPEAVALLKSLLNATDGFAPAQRRLASIDYFSGRHKEAYERLASILQRLPKNEFTLIQHGRFRMLERNPAAALADADVAVKENAKSVGGYYLRGLALRATGNADDARKAFQEVVRLQPTATVALLQLAELELADGNAAAALSYADQIIKQEPRSGGAHLVRAGALLSTRNMVMLDREVQGLLKGSPNSPEVQLLVGDYYTVKGDRPSARTAYERALELRPGAIAALTGLVTADVQDGKPDVAVVRMSDQLNKTPNDPAVLILAGKTFLSANDPQRAEQAFRRVIEVNPASFQGYRLLASLYVKQKRLDEAVNEFEQVAQRSPKNAASATTMVGMILMAQGKRDAARAQYEKAVQLDPKDPIASNNLAWDYAEAGVNLDVALNLAQVAKGTLPDDPDINDTLGWVYYKKGLSSLAVTAFETAAKRDPQSAGIRYRLGLAYLKNGDSSKARQSLEQALKIGDNFKDADDARRVLATLKG